MARVERTTSIDAPVEKVFDYWSDPTNHLHLWLNIVHVTNVEQLPNGGSRHRWTYSLGGMRLDGTVEDIEFVANQRIVSTIKGAIKSTFRTRFQPGDGGARVTTEVEYTVPIPLLGKLAVAFIIRGMEWEIDSALANLKARMER